jgi:hypothetical protein
VVTFKEILAQAIDWLQQDRRLSYCALKQHFDLDDDSLENLRESILFAHPQVVDEAGQGVVWRGEPLAPQRRKTTT